MYSISLILSVDSNLQSTEIDKGLTLTINWDWQLTGLILSQLGSLFGLFRYFSDVYAWIHNQDCLYRNMYRFDYIAAMDLDEVIVPVNHTSWEEMMRHIQGSGQKSSHVIFQGGIRYAFQFWFTPYKEFWIILENLFSGILLGKYLNHK